MTKQITVTVSGSMRAYSIVVDDMPIETEHDKGSIQLDPANEPFFLCWWMMGNEQAQISIVGKDQDREVVRVSKRKIPKGKSKAAGYKQFKIS